ncbi:MAG TPA: carbamate kinase [Pseudolysinimonas sp.]|nr:carbamate kinase [Pseudolysinimonas sp.]
MRIVVALGGNALLRRGERPEAQTQHRRVHEAILAIAAATAGHELVVVHGNGPQVGMLALESSSDPALERPYPLGDLTAETQGLIGHWIAEAFGAAAPVRAAAALISHVVVDPADPAFGHPTKPIGPLMTAGQARTAHRRWGWAFAPDGTAMRRVVASPSPLELVEAPAAEALLASRCIPIVGGGGGIAVTARGEQIDAVIDKDLVAAMIGIRLGADRLVILTDVEAVVDGYGTPGARPLTGPSSTTELRAMAFAAGSMGPKVDAACRFAEATGGVAAIGALDDAAAVIAGTAGTQVVRG